MARHKDADWQLDAPVSSMGQAQLAVLMDIRDELKILTTIFNCFNFRDVPNILRGIRKKLPTRKRKKRK